MNKPVKNVLCYSQFDFENIMKDNKWYDNISDNIAAISVCESDGSTAHYFTNDCHTTNRNIFNLDIDDESPFWFKNHISACYDKSLDLYLNGKVKESNRYFNNVHISGLNDSFCDLIHVMDYEEAYDLVKWIDNIIRNVNTIFVHCTAGKSRSQAIVRYIVDIYSDEFDININKSNPNITYNPHVLLMLKRAYNELLYSGYFDEK